MTPWSAWRDGVRRVNSAPLVLVGMCTLTLLVALPLSLALRRLIAAHLGDSLFADTLAAGASYDWWQEFSAQATGLGTTFVPSIIGFGAVLNNLSGLLDNLPHGDDDCRRDIAAWLVLWSFLSGGVLDRYARMRPTRASGFFAACGTHFWRFLRLGVLGLAGVLGALQPRAPVVVRGRLSVGHAQRHRGAHRVCDTAHRLPRFRKLLILSNVVFDYARIRIVVEDRRTAVGALLAGARFVRRHPAVLRLYLINGGGFVLLALLYALVSPGAPSGFAIWIALAIGQFYIVLRHYVKLLFYASQTAFFQSQLAHAAYTAAPACRLAGFASRRGNQKPADRQGNTAAGTATRECYIRTS